MTKMTEDLIPRIKRTHTCKNDTRLNKKRGRTEDFQELRDKTLQVKKIERIKAKNERLSREEFTANVHVHIPEIKLELVQNLENCITKKICNNMDICQYDAIKLTSTAQLGIKQELVLRMVGDGARDTCNSPHIMTAYIW